MIKFLGGSKKEPEKPPTIGKGFIPSDKVKDLSSKGFSEAEIIDILRKDGFSSEEIDRALTQAIKIGVADEGEMSSNLFVPPTQESFEQETPTLFQPFQQEQQTKTMQMQEYYVPQNYISEELIESIVHEKMVDLDERLVEFKNKYSELERKIMDLRNQLSIMAKGGKERESELISKVDALRDGVEELSARLSSLEKTFKDALPSLIESVRALTDLVHEMKRKG
ncbi:MAG: hypothetical protein NZ893_00570 [Candidatus Aenigmarchaeota archaeon]|nr:hypothetical protein [Candidatus Aenigmarchaeota archaeon]